MIVYIGNLKYFIVEDHLQSYKEFTSSPNTNLILENEVETVILK